MPTHAAVRVVINGDPWLADVGLGGGPLAPLPLRDGYETQLDGSWRHRITSPRSHLWQLETQLGNRWSPTHTFSERKPTPAEMQASNRTASTNATSPFVGRPILIRIDETQRLALIGTELRTSTPDGTQQRRTLSPPQQLNAIENDFHITLDNPERDAVVIALHRTASQGGS